jgi:chorismate mutase
MRQQHAKLNLLQIAADLENLEETIIARLIDRAQFRHNPTAYHPGSSGFKGEAERSLFAIRLQYQERMDACFGRFCVPEERPFNRCLPAPKRRVNLPPTCLRISDYDQVNLTAAIMQSYLALLPAICLPGDDAQYGSSVEHDVYAIQAIARRIHYGAMYVAESKYLANPRDYQAAIDARDTDRLMAMLTRLEVEEKILQRVAQKTAVLQASAGDNTRVSIDSATVRAYYADDVIPLTKQGEILYLQHRTCSNAQQNDDAQRLSTHNSPPKD